MNRAQTSLAILSLFALACAPKPTSTAPDEPTPATATPAVSQESDSAGEEEASVRPGVNDGFFEAETADKWIERFEREGREVVDQQDAILKALKLEAGMQVADIGAGTGLFVDLLAGAVGPEGRVVAVDIAPIFLERLRARAEGKSNVEVLEGGIKESRLEPSSFDLLFVANVYHHLEFPITYLESLKAALRPGGSLVIIDFHRIEGVTSEPMMKHVRAGQETVRREVESVGFVHAESLDWMRENYWMRFTAP